jgi:hypothetical protein
MWQAQFRELFGSYLYSIAEGGVRLWHDVMWRVVFWGVECVCVTCLGLCLVLVFLLYKRVFVRCCLSPLSLSTLYSMGCGRVAKYISVGIYTERTLSCHSAEISLRLVYHPRVYFSCAFSDNPNPGKNRSQVRTQKVTPWSAILCDWKQTLRAGEGAFIPRHKSKTTQTLPQHNATTGIHPDYPPRLQNKCNKTSTIVTLEQLQITTRNRCSKTCSTESNTDCSRTRRWARRWRSWKRRGTHEYRGKS